MDFADALAGKIPAMIDKNVAKIQTTTTSLKFNSIGNAETI